MNRWKTSKWNRKNVFFLRSSSPSHSNPFSQASLTVHRFYVYLFAIRILCIGTHQQCELYAIKHLQQSHVVYECACSAAYLHIFRLYSGISVHRRYAQPPHPRFLVHRGVQRSLFKLSAGLWLWQGRRDCDSL